MAAFERSTTNGSHMSREPDPDDNPDQSRGKPLLHDEEAEQSENGNNINPGVKKGCWKKASKKRLAVRNVSTIVIAAIIGGIIGAVLSHYWPNKREKTCSEPQAPAEPKGLMQNSTASSVESHILLESLGKYKSAGLDMYVRGRSSDCPSDVCRVCKQIVYKDSQPSIKADRDPGRTDRVKNNTCFRCDNNSVCIGFPDILSTKQNCSVHNATCWEKAKMANLNDYCKDGIATCYNKTLICNCSHGNAGSRCEKKENTTVVLCNCYKGLKLVEELEESNVKDCGNEYYNHNLTCTLTVHEEHCFCRAVEDEAKVKSLPSCEERKPKAGRQTSNVAQTVKVPNAVLILIVFFASVMMCDDR